MRSPHSGPTFTNHDSLYIRRQIRVTAISVHENFTDSVNDLALLRLGKKDLSSNLLHKQLTEERVDLAVFSPACLPGPGESFLDQNGTVSGKRRHTGKTLLSYAGWGDTGVEGTSRDRLQVTDVPIVQSSICIQRMDPTEDVDENLIVCAGGASEGPCKVCTSNQYVTRIMMNAFKKRHQRCW